MADGRVLRVSGPGAEVFDRKLVTFAATVGAHRIAGRGPVWLSTGQAYCPNPAPLTLAVEFTGTGTGRGSMHK